MCRAELCPCPKRWNVIGLEPGLCRSNLFLCTFQLTMWAGLLLPNQLLLSLCFGRASL